MSYSEHNHNHFMIYQEILQLLENSTVVPDVSYSGPVIDEFRYFLDAFVGFYASNVLIEVGTGSNIIYQYDYEQDKLKSMLGEVDLNQITSWKLFTENESLSFELYTEDVCWSRYFVAKLSYFTTK